MFDFQQLRQLVAIEETGSLSAAAEQLYLSQPALSRSMQRLEADLGVTLFERKRNRIVFGEVGKRAVDGARRLLAAVQNYKSDLQDYAVRLSIVRIGASSPAPLWKLSSLIHERFPSLIVAEEQQPVEQLLTGLREGRYRLILTHIPIAEEGILCQKYLEERLMLELPRDHELCARSALEERDLQGLTLLAYRHVGIWRERVRSIGDIHMIEQTELDVLADLALSTGLPRLVSSLGASRTSSRSGRVTLPIFGENTVLPFHLCASEQDRELFDALF